LENPHDVAGQWQVALFPAFAQNAQLGLGQLQIFELKGQNLAGTQPIQQHQAHDSKIPEGMEAVPETSDLFGGERLDHAPRFFEAKTEGDSTMWAAITERAT
jgi:hypothetical protein